MHSYVDRQVLIVDTETNQVVKDINLFCVVVKLSENPLDRFAVLCRVAGTLITEDKHLKILIVFHWNAAAHIGTVEFKKI